MESVSLFALKRETSKDPAVPLLRGSSMKSPTKVLEAIRVKWIQLAATAVHLNATRSHGSSKHQCSQQRPFFFFSRLKLKGQPALLGNNFFFSKRVSYLRWGFQQLLSNNNSFSKKHLFSAANQKKSIAQWTQVVG